MLTFYQFLVERVSLVVLLVIIHDWACYIFLFMSIRTSMRHHDGSLVQHIAKFFQVKTFTNKKGVFAVSLAEPY